MKIKELALKIDLVIAPKFLQESYDNCGLIVGNSENEITGVLTTLDINEFVVEEAIAKKCNLIVSHHPIIFRGLKTLNWDNSNEKVVMMAIKNDIAIYAAHTSLDNTFHNSINEYLAIEIGLTNITPLKLKNEVFPSGGTGAIGILEKPAFIIDFLCDLKQKLKLINPIRYSNITKNSLIQKVAICSGAGFSMVDDAKKLGADLFITSDLTYHNFFDEKKIVLADMGHYESEKHASVIIANALKMWYPELVIIISETNTNPVSYAL